MSVNNTSQKKLDLIDQVIMSAFEQQLPINEAIAKLLALGVTKENIDDYQIYKGYDE